MKTLLLSSLLAVILVGCSHSPAVRPIEIVSTPIERVPLNISMPEPVSVNSPKWVVITPNNVDKVFAEMQASGQLPVIIGTTATGYQQLSATMAEIRNLVQTQREILVKYKEYYEPQK